MRETEPYLNETALRPFEVYRAVLDPEGVLPHIDLKVTNEGSDSADLTVLHKSREPLDAGSLVIAGRVMVRIDEQARTGRIKYITLNDYWREHEQKFGYATYLELIRYLLNRGVRLISGEMLSKGAYGVWKGLESRGLARRTKEATYFNENVYSNYTNAQFELI